MSLVIFAQLTKYHRLKTPMTSHPYLQAPGTGDIQEHNPLSVQLFPSLP